MPALKILFIIDPPEHLDPPTDTSLAFMQESLRRGHDVFFATVVGLHVDRGRPLVRGWTASFEQGRDRLSGSSEALLDLSGVDAVFMRKDPPVDLTYLHAAEILDLLPQRILQINPPAALRLHGEKVIPLHFPDLMPETLVAACPDLLASLFERHDRIVVKPLEDCSGRGVRAIDRDDPDREEKLRLATADGARFVQGQEFLPRIDRGDIRVLMLGGKVLGQVRRVPAAGDFLSNINAGGRCEPCELSAEDRAICERIGIWLQKNGVPFAGIDIVAGKVLEVNITSPSCLREINDLYGKRLEKEVIGFVERRITAARR